MKDTVAQRVRFGTFELDLRAGELRQGERKIALQEQPLQVLRILIECDGKVATREEIQNRLWPNNTIVEFDHAINTAIKKIRAALGDSADQPKYVETVARRGYRLKVPVEWLSSAGDATPRGGTPVAADGVAVRQQLEPDSLTGKTVSHYRVLEVVGGGGMGVIYRAEDIKLGRAVALKFLPEDVGNDPRALERFEREARAASALEHSNICSIYEFGEHEGRPFIVMQLLQGQTLRDLLAKLREESGQPQGLALGKLLDFAIQISDGLEAAHEKGIIHRDIKPANIFIGGKGAVKILDFGLAKLTEADDLERPRAESEATGLVAPPAKKANALGLSHPGVVLGTAAYMSPEQVRGETLDARTDLFSFGLVLYEMATGRQAFTSNRIEVLQKEILNSTPVPALQLNPQLPAKLGAVLDKCLQKNRDQRYQHAAEVRSDLEKVKREAEHPSLRRWALLAAVLVVVIALAVGGLYWRLRRGPTLTEKDTIVIADFANSTGDAVFDGTLRQGLSAQLEQSPFLNLLSDQRIAETLSLMSQPKDARLTPEVAREVCQRTGSEASIEGAIATLGRQYVVGLRAMNCHNGDLLAEEQVTADSKEQVLSALGKAASQLRRKLGEKLVSIQKYDAPTESVTTGSLEALKAYSLGQKTRLAKGDPAALPFYKRAIELDPTFAMPYVAMANIYVALNEVGRAADNARRAYELREKVSERERYSIEGTYYLNATGELDKAAQAYELWRQAYPRDYQPYRNLAFISAGLGNLENLLEDSREALRLEPNNESNYLNLGNSYANLDRFQEAETVYKQADERKLNSDDLLVSRYQLAFLKVDPAQMAAMISAAAGKPGIEDALLAAEADTAAWYGKMKDSRELTRRAVDAAVLNDARETAATYLGTAALREVESGNPAEARANAEAAVKLAPNRDVRAMAALAWALTGDATKAEKLANELDREFPLDTLVQRYWLPTIRAAVALQRKDPNGAVELLKTASVIELGQVSQATGFLSPIYLRGRAYLMLRDGKAARAEFQKFIDHRGMVVNAQWGALARLGLARAYGLDASADSVARDKARAAYQDFLSLWKDADPEVPILKKAKAEYETVSKL